MLQSSEDQQDKTEVEQEEAEVMVNILQFKASDSLLIERGGSPAPLCLSENQIPISGSKHSKTVNERLSLTEKEMLGLDTNEESNAMAPSAGEAQVLI